MSVATFNVSTDEATLALIDANAAREGLSRSAYVLQWLPEANANGGNQATKRDGRSARKASTAG